MQLNSNDDLQLKISIPLKAIILSLGLFITSLALGQEVNSERRSELKNKTLTRHAYLAIMNHDDNKSFKVKFDSNLGSFQVIINPNSKFVMLGSSDPESELYVKGLGIEASENGLDFSVDVAFNGGNAWSFTGIKRHVHIREADSAFKSELLKEVHLKSIEAVEVSQ